MAVSTKKVLRMVFTNSTGNTMTLTLPSPKADLESTQIEAVMDQIIEKNIFLSPGGDLISKQDIKIIDTTTNDLYDLPIE